MTRRKAGKITNKGVDLMNTRQTSLAQCRNADILTCDPDELVDLRDVHIDTTRTLSERMDSFLQQVGNPYLFKVDGLIVKTVYPANASRRLTDALPYC